MNHYTTRIKIFDITKGFAIFLVLWGHCIQHLQNDEYDLNDNILFNIIYSFHMPLFMIVSGYFANSVLKYSIKDLLIKKIGQLILPTIPFGLLFCIIYKFLFNNSWGGGNSLFYKLLLVL